MKKENVLAIRSVTAIFWLGFFMAISFLETPLKFKAPGLSIAEGLQIGRIVFRYLNTCEWLFLAIVMLTCLVKKPSRNSFYLIITISIIMVMETAWLLPVLDTRAVMVIKGESPQGHLEHWVYIMLEITKVPILLLIGLQSGLALRESKPDAINS